MIIAGGRVIDPENNIDEMLDILIEGGQIVDIGKSKKWPSTKVIDATGMWVVPGLIDIHTHLREPGFEYKETIKSGTLAAAKGGFTSIACMANTLPINDNRSVTEYILQKAKHEAVVNLFVIAAITKGLNGKELSEMGDLKNAGAIAFSDDGKGVQSPEVMRRAMEYSSMLGLPIISHCEDECLAGKGVMNEGPVSTELGLAGIPREAEEIMAFRDIALAALTGARVHIAHVSSPGTIQQVRAAKKRGIYVTCETAPHYFTITDESVRGYDANFKMKPPLCSIESVEAIKKGLKDGTIDVIATDHAPHEASEKEVEFVSAPFGVVGLETALPLILNLVRENVLTPLEAIKKITINPAKVIGIPKGTLGIGKSADITIIDPESSWIVNSAEFMSKGRNTPFQGRKMVGEIDKTIVAGKIVYRKKSKEV